MVFTVPGAVAELERSLIAEHVRAGLWNARAKGKRLGRPRGCCGRVYSDPPARSGVSWASIADELGVGEGTVRRSVHSRNQGLSGRKGKPRLQPGPKDTLETSDEE